MTALPGWAIDPLPPRTVVDAVLDQVPLGVIAVEADTGRVLVANAEARRLMGEPGRVTAPPGDGPGWAGTNPDGTRYSLETWPVSRSLRGEIVDHELVEVRGRDDARSVIELSSRPVHDAGGRVVAAVVVFQDVTVRENQERAMADFVVNAAHQLQSPLAAIISSVEVLQSGAKDGPEREKFLTHLERESHRLGRLVNALLTLARAETGVAAYRRELVALEPLLVRMAHDSASVARVAVTVSCDEGLGVIANGAVIEQALQGLLDNAVKYTPSGTIRICGHRRGESIELIVEDTGLGIPVEEHQRIWERFQRADSASGFGLGLSIVRAAVGALGGEVSLDSERGRGTKVTITLPNAASVTP